MNLIGPHNRPLDQEKYVSLGGTFGATDYDYYLFDDGKVWCFESPNNGYSPSRWYVIEEKDWDSRSVEGKTIRQLVDENRGRVP